jgi:hypothetical protein
VKRRELGRHRLADDDRPARARDRDSGRVPGGAMTGIDRRAVGRRRIDGVEQILDTDRKSVQRTCRCAAVERARPLERRVAIDVRPRAHVAIALADALQTVGDESLGGNLARGELARRVGRGQTIQRRHVVSPGFMGSRKWHAAKCARAISTSFGSSCRQRSNAYGQRV